MESPASFSALGPLPHVEADLLFATFTGEGAAVFRNDVWLRVLGSARDPWALVAEEDQERARRYVADASTGLLVRNEFFLLADKPDDPLPLLLNFLPVHAGSEGQPSVAAVMVTGEVLREPDTWMQNQTQRNRIETLGRMTMGIAHDFNNLLSGILGYAELLKSSVDDNEPVETQQEYLNTIERAALDGAALIRKIQQYIRQEQQTQFEALDLPALIEDCVSLTRPYWFNEPRRQGISIDLELEVRDVPPIMGSATELREVFINLILNAVQAMPDGGQISIDIHTRKDGAVQVDVADTGTGMPDHVRERIFEPLFTTKGARGSGMGLAVSYGIVQEHDGRIEVFSGIGSGTRFTLIFPPAASGSRAVVQDEPEPSAKPARILIVDDEKMVRSLLIKLLSRRGHDVVEASSGAQALDILQSAGGDFDIVFTDHGMPDMNGRQFASRVRAWNRHVPIVLLTGDTEVGGPDEVVNVVLGKPFKLHQLDAAIRELVGDRGA